ncbi:MAG: CHC2 zinc finger domain-containing protein [Planctomycetota bacterium]|jgi:DNA primase
MRPDAKEIKARIDLVEYLASLGIELKPVGAGGEYRGVCPLPSHGDAVPSFQVNHRKGLWHCFGCGAGGDVISFVMKREGVGFQEALAILAGPAGLDEPVRSEGADRGYVFCAAADYWSKCLGGSTSARGYLERRGIGSPEIVERYGIGFAPGRTRTRDWLLTKGFELSQIEAAGLVNRRGLDSFFGRVTFPLAEDGSVVNVYGRSLSANYKHMYLPARRDVIFNIDHVEGERAILTESVIDALSLVAIGIDNAVSSLSARLTRHQLDVLAAQFARVDIAFDGDDAGAKGAAATAGVLRERGVDCTVIAMPAGSDVNSLVTGGMTRGDFEDLVGPCW